MAWEVTPGPVGGRLTVPGDKSISHRALMLGAIADGETRVEGFLAGADCLATLAALRALGVEVERSGEDRVRIAGVGLRGLARPAAPLDMGNSGTAMRLFAGLLSAQAFDSELVGDESLTRRPMERVAAPLRSMGAVIETRDGCPPLVIRGGRRLHGIRYALPIASAQVKSALLLAGLYAEGETVVVEPAVSRDHTERMLADFGARIERRADEVRLEPGARLAGRQVHVPGDLSSAAFFLLAGAVSGGRPVVLDHVGLNPTRTGVLSILRLMGARIDVEPQPGTGAGEPVGRITVSPGPLRGIAVPPELVPLAIDEFPVVFVAAALAEGATRISGAAELRHKESDRIAVMAEGLRALGVHVDETPDGAVIHGGRLATGTVDSHGDHRVAMAFAAGAAAADGPVRIRDTANVATSFPGFAARARSIGLALDEIGRGG